MVDTGGVGPPYSLYERLVLPLNYMSNSTLVQSRTGTVGLEDLCTLHYAIRV